MESTTTVTLSLLLPEHENPFWKGISREHSLAEELENIRMSLRGAKDSNLSELAAVTMQAADREAAFHEWLCQEYRVRGWSPPPDAGCKELMQTLLTIVSISTIEFDREIDGCIDVRIGTVSIGWIGVDEGIYTPMFRDFQELQYRTWNHPENPTLEDAKAWITEQWEELKKGLTG